MHPMCIDQVMSFINYPTANDYKSPHKETPSVTCMHPLHIEIHAEEPRVASSAEVVHSQGLSDVLTTPELENCLSFDVM